MSFWLYCVYMLFVMLLYNNVTGPNIFFPSYFRCWRIWQEYNRQTDEVSVDYHYEIYHIKHDWNPADIVALQRISYSQQCFSIRDSDFKYDLSDFMIETHLILSFIKKIIFHISLQSLLVINVSDSICGSKIFLKFKVRLSAQLTTT